MKPLDPTKQYTLNGHPVKILGSHGDTLTAAVQTNPQNWHVVNRQLDGTAFPWAAMPSPNIIEVPETKTLDVWLNVYPGISTHAYLDRAHADRAAHDGREACVHVIQEYKVGEGL